MPRDDHNFPSRQYAYLTGTPAALGARPPKLAVGCTSRFVLGRDPKPVVIEPADGLRLLHDPLAQLVLFAGPPLPMTARELLQQLDAFNGTARGLPRQRSFLVAEGGQIPWTRETDDLRREFRFLITRQGAAAGQPDLLVSTGTALDSPSMFLQVVAWDPAAGALQFYERRDGAWAWAGNSWDALEDDARGKGPFDSHVNGALNMKELKQPWVHWHSMAAQIRDTALRDGDPLVAEPLWRNREGAEDFEIHVARPEILRWTAERFRRSMADGTLTRLPTFMRQVLQTTTVNLVASPDSAPSLPGIATVRLPLTFFVSADMLFDAIGLSPNIQPPAMPSAVYQEVIGRFEVELRERTHRFAGETEFVFAVPEPAFEDVALLDALITGNVLSKRIAAALLMVDFSNPVFSPRRAALLPYVPASAAPGAFETAFVGAVQNSPRAAASGSPEQEFLANWALPNPGWQQIYERRIEAFFAAVAPALATADGFSPLFELADSRRREFRRHKLAEFTLTLPFSKIPKNAPFLALTPGGSVVRK